MKKWVSKLLVCSLLAGSLVGCSSKGNDTAKTETKDQLDVLEEATEASTEAPKPSKFLDVKVGDTITFGTYEQDENESNGKEDIEWTVLDENDDAIFVITKGIIEYLPFAEDCESRSWDCSTIRYWLNDTFYHTAFTDEEKDYILVDTVVSDRADEASPTETRDRIFLLSIDETEKYFPSESSRIANFPEYLRKRVTYLEEYTEMAWWLRSLGEYEIPGLVGTTGEIYPKGENPELDEGIRPVAWLSKTAVSTDENFSHKEIKMEAPSNIVDLKEAKVGDFVTYGTYEQDGNEENGKEPIEWLVLKQSDDELMLFSKYGLDQKRFNETREVTTWEQCTLRTWLNDEFYNTAFSADEQKSIKTTKVTADENPLGVDYSGNDTEDKVYLLSGEEFLNYFNGTELADYGYCDATNYAADNGVIIGTRISDAACLYWLRTMGDMYTKDCAARIYRSENGLNDDGWYVDCDYIAVRPIIRVKR